MTLATYLKNGGCVDGSLCDEAAAEIDRLTDAIWEYGQHRPSCRIGDGKECDCGFFDVIKTLKD